MTITRHHRFLAVLAACTIGLPLLATTQVAHAAGADCDRFTTDLRQLVRPSSDASLLTRWDSEAEIAEQRYGFSDDRGVVAQVSATGGEGLVGIRRLYRGGDFVWAAEGGDADALVAQGYARQSVDFYAASDDTSCLSPVYRMERSGIHRMATAGTADLLEQDGWQREEVGFYAISTDAAPPSEPGPAPAPPPAPAPAPGGTDTTFTLAVVPDTQNESNSANDPRFANRVDWLVQNKSAIDLRYAVQVGDIVNWGNAVPAQFTNVSTGIKPLEASVPWAGAIGNHDTAAVCVGGSGCPGANANVAVRDTRAYNAAFPVSRFPNLRGTFETGKIDNAYQTFSAGGVDWLVLSLELWPRASAITWARSVVASHPDHNVIVTTHAYLDGDGSISGSNGGYGATSPRYLFDNLIKVYPNVKMVLSGHVGDSAVRTDTGVNGNKVVSLLQTFHSPTNPVRLVEIDTAAGVVNSRVYAPYTKTDYPAYRTQTTGLSFVR